MFDSGCVGDWHGSGVQKCPEGLDGRQLILTGSVYFAGEGSIESLECTKEFVGRGGRWAWKFVVPEVDGVT